MPEVIFNGPEGRLEGRYQQGKDQNGPVGAFSNAYALYYNDNVNQIRVVSEYKDDWQTREDLMRIAPREDLEKLARAFLDAYTHAWAP